MRVFDILRSFRLPHAVAVAAVSAVASGQSSIRCWGKFGYDTRGREDRCVQVDCAGEQTAVLRADGRIFVNGENSAGIIHVPTLPRGLTYTEVAISNIAGAALVSDGTISVWGLYSYAMGMPPTLPPAPALPPGLRYTQVVVAAHGLALRSDGTIVAWGNNQYGQCNVPPLPPGVFVRRLRAEEASSYALLSDGSVLAWGDDNFGQLQIPPLPPGVEYVDVREGYEHCVAVRSDGMIVAWGGSNQ